MAHDEFKAKPASPETLGLIHAAVVASPPIPVQPDARDRWVASVGQLAEALYRQAQKTSAEIARYAECTMLPATIVEVSEQSGRGVVKIRPALRGRQEFEVLRTPWLREERGAALLALARSLVGQECRVGKYQEAMANKPGETASMVAWIEPLGPSEPAGAQQVHDPEPATQPTDHQPSVPYAQLASGGGSTPRPRRGHPDPGPPQSPPPSASPKTPVVDLAELRNQPMKNWDDLMVAGYNHFGLDGDTIHAIGMEQCGAAGPRTTTEYRKTWNAVVTKYWREPAVA